MKNKKNIIEIKKTDWANLITLLGLETLYFAIWCVMPAVRPKSEKININWVSITAALYRPKKNIPNSW